MSNELFCLASLRGVARRAPRVPSRLSAALTPGQRRRRRRLDQIRLNSAAQRKYDARRGNRSACLVLDGLVLLVADMAANPGWVMICGRLRLAVSLAGRGAALTSVLAGRHPDRAGGVRPRMLRSRR